MCVCVFCPHDSLPGVWRRKRSSSSETPSFHGTASPESEASFLPRFGGLETPLARLLFSFFFCFVLADRSTLRGSIDDRGYHLSRWVDGTSQLLAHPRYKLVNSMNTGDEPTQPNFNPEEKNTFEVVTNLLLVLMLHNSPTDRRLLPQTLQKYPSVLLGSVERKLEACSASRRLAPASVFCSG